MIRFSAWAPNYFRYLRDRELISFFEKKKYLKQSFDVYFTEVQKDWLAHLLPPGSFFARTISQVTIAKF